MKYAWMCTALELDNSYTAPYLSDLIEENQKRLKTMTPDEILANLSAPGSGRDERNGAGEILDAGMFPKKAFFKYKTFSSRKGLKHAMNGGTGPIISPQVAEVMRRFDLGQCRFFPIELFKFDRKSKVGDYFCVNYGNAKDAFLPEESRNFRINSGFTELEGRTVYDIFGVKRDDIALSPCALEGPDFWVDPKLNGLHAISFVSDRLAQALKEAGVTGTFPLRRVRVLVD